MPSPDRPLEAPTAAGLDATLAVSVAGVRHALGGVEILRGVGFQVRRGEVASIMGPSGSGKTTLLSMLAGLRIPDAGRVVIDGQVLQTLDEAGLTAIRRDRVGFLSQDFLLLSELSAERNVAVPLLLAGVAPTEAVRRAGEVLDGLGLGAQRALRVAVLSRGQQQRVALARALVLPRPVLLLDEPTSSLDAAAIDRVLEHLRHAAARGEAVVLTTHDERVAAMADRRYRLREGRLEEATTG